MNETALNLLLNRRSIRAYKDKKVTEEEKELLLKCALASPSAGNRQPWHFTFVEDQALLDEINAEMCRQRRLLAANEDEARRWDGFHVFFHAPLVVFISGPARPNHGKFSELDDGIACENIVLGAEALGLGSCILGFPMAAFEGDRAAELSRKLKFPEGYEFKVSVSIGQIAATKGEHPIGENKYDFIG